MALNTLKIHFPNITLICLVIIFISKVENSKLRHDIEESPPRIFKIIDNKYDVSLKKENYRNYDQRKLIEFLKNNADLEYHVHNILKSSRNNSLLKKKLIKRKVKHGKETSDLQFNSKSNSYFRPLVRLHKIRDSVAKAKKVDIQLKKKVFQRKTRPIFFKVNDKPNTRQRSNEERKTTEAQHAIMHLAMIDSQLKKLGKNYLRTDFYVTLNTILKDIETLHKDIMDYSDDIKLRSGAPFLDEPKSHEETTYKITFAPGVTMFPENQTAVQYNCAMYPSQPIWNYWTYAQTIHLDECPIDQVKIGNVCSWIPPHKKK